MFDPINKPRYKNAKEACMEYEEESKTSTSIRVLGGRNWPEKVNKKGNVKIITETSSRTSNKDFDFEDGVISPKEFDDAFDNLQDGEITQLMTDVLTHPMIHKFT